MTDAAFVAHEPCPKCSSSDAFGRYDDGHGYCFSCGHYERGDGTAAPSAPTKRSKSMADLIECEPFDRTVRGITPETFRKWRYSEGEHKGQRYHVANHYKDGQLVGQKLRGRGKKFSVRGELEPLYGQWLWPANGKMVVVTEGEIDALSVSQAQGNQWPVVSVANGAQGAAKSVSKALKWLLGFEKVVFMFDMDEPGRKAAEECAKLLPPGRASIAKLTEKDPNALLQLGDTKSIVQAIWNAEPYRPDGIVSLADCIEDALKPPEWGTELAFPTLTEWMFGARRGEWYCIGAGVGVGKSDFITQLMAHYVHAVGEPIGILALEQPNAETSKRLAGKIDGRLYHVPDAEYDTAELRSTLEELQHKVFLYDHFGSTDWDSIAELIRYLRHGCGVRTIFLDHLTAVAAHAEDERRYLDSVCAELSSLCQELGITMWVISHLTTPKGESHEEGGRVKESQFTGSRAIARWAHFMFGLERNKQDEDEEARHITTVRCLKDRYTGRASGKTFHIRYDQDTGLLDECQPADSGPFEIEDETETEF